MDKCAKEMSEEDLLYNDSIQFIHLKIKSSLPQIFADKKHRHR